MVVIVPRILFHSNVKPCKTHVIVNALSRLLNITKPIGVFD